MTTLLSRLMITGYGTYADFYPQPTTRPGGYEVDGYDATGYQVDDYVEETPLIDGVETKLLSPLVFEQEVPDTFDGTPGTRRITAALSNVNINKIPAPRLLLGVAATGELWNVEANTLIEEQSGIITRINSGPDRLTLTIEENAAAPLQVQIPKRLVRDVFPSADFSNLGVSGDPAVIWPWGTMYKVPLPLCQRPYLHIEFQMVGSAESFCYVNMDNVPQYLVKFGDVLEYDVRWFIPSSQIAVDLATAGGVTLRASGTVDQSGLSVHPATDLNAVAFNQWYRRTISLSALVGQTLFYYTLGCESNVTGGYGAHFGNIRIVNSQGELQLTIFDDLTTTLFSTVTSNPVGNTSGSFKSNTWDYGPFRTPLTPGALSIHSVYRSNAVTFDASVAEPLPGLTTVRFTTPQRDTNGGPAVISATFTSTEYGNNPAAIKQALLSDPIDGCGVPIDTVSFGDAAMVLDGAAIFAEGGLSSQRLALDVIGDLTFHGEAIGVNDLGQYTDTADSAAIHVLNAVHAGEGEIEPFWENITFEPASYNLLDQYKQLTFKAQLIRDFGGSESYAVSQLRLGSANGSTVTREFPYLAVRSVDREVYYYLTKNQASALYRAEFSADSLELQAVKVNDLIQLHTGNDPDLDGRVMLVSKRTSSAGGLAFSVQGFDPNIYNYVSQPVQSLGIPPLVDYRFTIPPQPIGFAIVAAVPFQTSDGTVKVSVTVQANAPNFNVSDLKFRANVVGSAQFIEVTQPVTLGQTAVQAVHNLEPGLSYDFTCYSYNGANAADFRFSQPVLIVAFPAPGDATTPAAGSAVLLWQAGAKAVGIQAVVNVPPDWGTILFYRNTVNDTASAVVIAQGKQLKHVDQDIVYGITYYYWFKVGDNTFVATGNPANLSPFSPSSGNSILIQRLITDDHTDDSISNPKLQNLSVSSAKIQDLAVGTAKIQDLAVGTAKIQDLAVSNAKIQDLAVTNAKINDLSATKIITGMLRVNQVGNGASEIMIDAPAAIRIESQVGAPASLIFQDGAGLEQSKVAGTGGALELRPSTNNNGIILQLGTSSFRWSSIGLTSANNIIFSTSGTAGTFIGGRLGTDALQSSVPPGTTPNRRLPLYSIGGTIIGYIWVSI